MRTLLAGCLAVGLPGLAQAQEKRSGTPAEQIKAIEKEFDTTLATANKELQTAAPDKRPEMIAKAREKFGKLIDEAVALAEANPNDPAAVPALSFVVSKSGYSPTGMPARAKAVAALKEKHLDKAGIAPALQALSMGPDGKDILRGVLDKNKDKAAQGSAAFLLGSRLIDESERAAGGKGPELAKEGEALLLRVEKEFADVTVNGQKLGEQAKDKLYVVRNLSIGKQAPEIKGADLDGKEFKLSDYRGKVVLLDFWGDW